ncbi:MAG: RnfABCDGE type electron transport complex subunit D [Lachnospiraceae bacterium]|nr:RnfABCDGE type electron transport complex subunit D [Lachnospiraceae bacterium]
MDNKIVSFSPHIRDKITTNRIMIDVLIALVPAFIAAVFIFGPRAALVTSVCVISCVFFEWLYQKALKKPVTINDYSACVTGVLLAYNLPVTIPLWQAVFGCAVAIVLVKQLFGGIGKNFANPAITARVVMFLAFSTTMTTWVHIPDVVSSATSIIPDGVSAATPLMLMSRGDFESLPHLLNMVIGTRGGSLGETSSVALLIGGIYLLCRRIITWHVPLAFIATTVILAAILGDLSLVPYHLFGGGLILGAFFMATDYPTTPQTNKGRVIFGIGCGIFTVVIRLYGNYPEGVSFAILFMNMLVPYINKFTLTKPLGGK